MMAPMQGLSSAIFRQSICDLGGVDTVATEFVRITSPKQRITPFIRHRVPLQVQFMGNSSQILSQCIGYLKERCVLSEKDWIDLNVGCPAKRVNSHGGGAALLKEPAKIKEIVLSIRQIHRGVLSIKMRVGYYATDEFSRLLDMLRGLPLDFITIHPRTRCDGYEEAADHTLVTHAVRELPYPVVANGDIFTAKEALTVLRTTCCHGIMCGRGVLRNPFLLKEIAEATTQNDASERTQNISQTVLALRDFFSRLFRKIVETCPQPNKAIGVLKEHSYWLSQNPLIGEALFQQIKTLKEPDQLINTLANSLNSLAKKALK